MKIRILVTFFITLVLFTVCVFAQNRTVVKSKTGKRLLVGKHLLSLQWISWEKFGTATVAEKKGVLYLKGAQFSNDKSEYIKIEGFISEVGRYNFKFTGKIEMLISHINGNKVCTREGDFNFAITKKRSFWRLQEMENPCDDVVDYVDIYLH
ncbi:MAG: hypothetical protein ACK5NT_05705 [Pyrinomonadaceae bacterium]